MFTGFLVKKSSELEIDCVGEHIAHVVCSSYLKNFYDVRRFLKFVVDIEIDVVAFVVGK